MTRFITTLLVSLFLGGCIQVKPPDAREWPTYDELNIPRTDPAILAAVAEQTKWTQSDVRDWRRAELTWGQIALISDMSKASRVPPDDIFETMRRRRAPFCWAIQEMNIRRELADRYKMDQHELPGCDAALAEIALRQAIIDVEEAKAEEIDGLRKEGYSFVEICEGYRVTGKGAKPDKVKDAMERLRRGETLPSAPIQPKQPEQKPSEQPAQPLPEQEPPKNK